MKPLYALLFRLLSSLADRIERVRFWLYLRLTDQEAHEVEMLVEVVEPRPDNVVHLPRVH